MAARHAQHCAEKNRLLAAYNLGVLEWSNAVKTLTDNAGDADFTFLLDKVDQARAKTQRAGGVCHPCR
jgi:hypothetical protein